MFAIQSPDALQYLLIVAVAIGSIARMGRLLVHDHWPPAELLRDTWDKVVPPVTRRKGGRSWNLLLHCHFCITVWLSYGVLLWGYFTDWNLIWWLVNAPLAISYAAAYVVTYDGDDS